MRYFGNINVRGEKSIITLDPWPDANNPYSGWVSWEPAIGVTTTGQALYYDKNSKVWRLACANSQATMPCRAISVESPNQNGEWGILRFGTFYTPRYNWNGQSLFIDPVKPGFITDIQPSGIGQFVQIIGTAKDYRVGFFDFCPIYVEVG